MNHCSYFAKRIAAFLVCGLFVYFFVADERLRIAESGKILTFPEGRAESSASFSTAADGLLAVSCLPDASCGPDAVLELKDPRGNVLFSGPAPAASKNALLRFPAVWDSAGKDFTMTLRRTGGELRECRFQCVLYAGVVEPSSRFYLFGGAAATVFFIVLNALELYLRKREGPPPMKQKSASFDRGIHYFRAFAILFIMLLHFRFGNPQMRLLNDALFSSASFYFVFISGYLFYYLTRSFEAEWSVRPLRCRVVGGKFSTLTYYKKKLLNIILPYVLISAVIYFYYYFASDTSYLTPAVPGALKDFLHRLCNGSVQQPYWYIIFIAKVFLISPLLLYLPRKWFCVLTAASCILPFLVARGQSRLLYFLPMYLIGIWYARFRPGIDRILYRNTVKIIVPLLAAAGTIWLYMTGSFHGSGTFILRILMTVCILYLTSFLARRDIPLLNFCADASFTLFFIHSFVYMHMAGLELPFGIFSEPILLVLMVTTCFLLAWALKTLFGRFSRYFIGS